MLTQAGDEEGLKLWTYASTMSKEEVDYIAVSLYAAQNHLQVCLEGPPGSCKTTAGKFLDHVLAALGYDVCVMSGEAYAAKNRSTTGVTVNRHYGS